MNKYNIYFDCASTVRPFKEVLDVFNRISVDDFANASSNHALGFDASSLLEKARGQIARYLNVNSDEVVFTSGATEANNLAIKGVAYHNTSWSKRIITTAGEHPSVRNVFLKLKDDGFDVVFIGYDKDGNLDIDALRNALKVPTSLVSIMAVNNEVGYIFPVKTIKDIVKQNDSRTLFHIDATQAIGKEDISTLDYDLMSFSGHKIGGLKGSGCLVKKRNVILDPQIIGGEQENGLRAGTTPLGLDCSLATALRMSLQSQKKRRENAFLINSHIMEGLEKIDEIEITSKGTCSPFILSFALKQHKGSVIAEALSTKGIYVSTKSACSSREEGYSYVLKNAGYDEIIASNGIRLSFDGNETIQQADEFLSELKNILNEIKIKE